MKVVVTGGAGFIGSHLVDLLISEDHEVMVVDDLSTGKNEPVLPDHLFRKLDIWHDYTALENAVVGFKPYAVIHLAAQASLFASEEEPGRDLLINGLGTVNVLRVAKAAGARRFVFASTSAIYADSARRALHEESKLIPGSPYGISKMAGEQYVRWLYPGYHVILRLGNVYGPRQVPIGENQLVAQAIRHFKYNEPFFIHGDGKQERDFVYVKDIARAFYMALNSKPGTFNISNGVPESVNFVAWTVAQLWGHDAYDFQHNARLDARRRVWLNVDKAKNEMGWEPKYTIEEGLTRTIEWWNEFQHD